MMTIKVCVVDDCDRVVQARAFCGMHYRRWQRHGDPHARPFRPRGTCSISGCEKSHMANGYCSMHGARWERNGHPLKLRYPTVGMTVEQRHGFYTYKTEDCWLWTGLVNAKGYAEMGRNLVPHRFAYERVNGPIPPGLTIDHVCHSSSACRAGTMCMHRRCVNPSHLEAVTHAENVRRSTTGRKVG